MPFGLKNAGATFQRLVDLIFRGQIGSTVEAYVDDIVVKSRKQEDHPRDLREVFETLRKYGMSLNPEKCVFGVTEGKFLGFQISSRGIEVNPDKVKAVLDMDPPRTVNEVQRFVGRVNYLGRFCARLAERNLPFFEILRKPKGFAWTPECQDAFERMKSHLSSLPILTSPVPGEVLQLYLSASSRAVSAVLVREQEHPVYFVSKALLAAETRYPAVEKAVLALVIAARKLRPYFHAHTIEVLSDLPLHSLLHRPTVSGRLTKWVIELSEFDIDYRPRPAIKAQVLADFITETSFRENPEELLPEGAWTLHTDGAVNAEGCGAGIVLTSPAGEKYEHSISLSFEVTNNEAEYEALIAGLELALAHSVEVINCFSD